MRGAPICKHPMCCRRRCKSDLKIAPACLGVLARCGKIRCILDEIYKRTYRYSNNRSKKWHIVALVSGDNVECGQDDVERRQCGMWTRGCGTGPRH
jgi:hypothetical protein